jgi:hypothetical protein
LATSDRQNLPVLAATLKAICIALIGRITLDYLGLPWIASGSAASAFSPRFTWQVFQLSAFNFWPFPLKYQRTADPSEGASPFPLLPSSFLLSLYYHR